MTLIHTQLRVRKIHFLQQVCKSLNTTFVFPTLVDFRDNDRVRAHTIRPRNSLVGLSICITFCRMHKKGRDPCLLRSSKMPKHARTTITVPPDLKARMEAVEESVNWSAIACQAFEQRLAEITRRRGAR